MQEEPEVTHREEQFLWARFSTVFITGCVIVILSSCLYGIISVKPTHAAGNTCKVALAIDRSSSIEASGYVDDMKNVTRSLFGPSGMNSEFYQIGFTSFATAGSGYTGRSAYPDGSFGLPGRVVFGPAEYPSYNAFLDTTIALTDNTSSSSATSTPSQRAQFRTTLDRIPFEIIGRDFTLGADHTNWEAGFSRNVHGILPDKVGTLSTLPQQADMIILLTDGEPHLGGEGGRTDDYIANAAADAVKYWRGQNKLVAGLLIDDDLEDRYMKTVLGTGWYDRVESGEYKLAAEKLRGIIKNKCLLLADYDLYPKTTFEDNTTDTVRSDGEIVKLKSQIFNNGKTDSVEQIPNTIYEYVTRPGQSKVPIAIFNKTKKLKDGTSVTYFEGAPYSIQNQAGCDWFSQQWSIPKSQCRIVTDFSLRTIYADNTKNFLATSSIDTTDSFYQPGDTICRFLAVRRFDTVHTGDNPTRRISRPACVTIGVKPKLQVWGGDVRVRGQISASKSSVTTNGAQKLYGSWVEYGSLSVGKNENFASGSGLNLGNSEIASSKSWNMLTFANIHNNASVYGTYSNANGFPSVPAISAQFTSQLQKPISGTINLSSTDSGVYSAKDLTITGGSVGLSDKIGKSIIIVASGTVVISGDIHYVSNGQSETYTSLKQLPQLVIIAKNITISGNVGHIDSWLLTSAGGSINTCNDRSPTEPLNISICNKRLEVNGPVTTQHLYLRRTATTPQVSDSTNAAEVFNLRPDAFLWVYMQSQQSGRMTSDYIVELPPRY